ncbi:MAG: ABC transporter permease [Rubripirellula sp.]
MKTPSPDDNPTLTNWLDRFDRWSDQIGDRLNPILIKETRQSLKSRQFVFTFFSLLAAALAWTIVGSLSRMPQIYTTPSAPTLMLGYYALLAVPMLLVVPLAAYRSLEVEIDDGTLELLSISVLTPWQIVLGKLSSALLQILLYFVVLFPCMAYAYTLRGVDLMSIFLMVSTLLGSGVLLTIIAIFFAPLTHSRTGRTLTLLITVIILLASVGGISSLMVSLILEGDPFQDGERFFLLASCVTLGPCLGHLLLTATAAQLTPASENRSSPLRRSLLAFSTALLFVSGLAILTLDVRTTRETTIAQDDILYTIIMSGWILWTLAGSMLAAESSQLTSRVKRALPSSLFHRSLSTWLTPGSVTGIIFVSINTILLVVWFGFGLRWLAARNMVADDYAIVVKRLNWTHEMSSTFAAYLLISVILVRYLLILIRRKQNPRIETGIAALVVIVILMALLPYSIGLHLNEFRPYAFSEWQVTNWAWTLIEIYNGNPPGSIPLIVKSVAFTSLLLLVVRNPQITRPRRTAMPERVIAELEQNTKAENAPSISDPFA